METEFEKTFIVSGGYSVTCIEMFLESTLCFFCGDTYHSQTFELVARKRCWYKAGRDDIDHTSAQVGRNCEFDPYLCELSYLNRYTQMY